MGDLNQNISIVPNPASFKVNVSAANGTTVSHIELYTTTGKRMDAHLHDDNSFDVRSLAEGIYFLKVISPEGSVTKKLIVKK